MDQARAATVDDGTTPPLSLCPKCGIRPRIRAGLLCRLCVNEAQRARRHLQKTSTKHCANCNQVLPHKGVCPSTTRRNFIARGRRLIEDRWPGYADLLPEDLVGRAGHSWPHVRFPHPSKVFAGLDPALDHRLIREARDKDVALCQALAELPDADQREFLELHLKDPADADRWARLPKWQRPIRRGDPDDQRIWKFFTMQRLNMEQAARDDPPWALASQGMQLPQMFGVLRDLSADGLRKLCTVMSTYGLMLGHREEVGNVIRKPWE